MSQPRSSVFARAGELFSSCSDVPVPGRHQQIGPAGFRDARFFAGVMTLILLASWWKAAESHAAESVPVSYHKQIRPIFQANCQGCHQPAKAGGGYVMTSFQQLLKAGESGEAVITARQPEASALLKQITPVDGMASMPKGKKPLAEKEIALIRQWIQEGAKDDSPANSQSAIDREHPPVYSRPPVITSIDFSPNGELLAVAGFHEVLLLKADGSQTAGRLVGMAERIESVRFSPDGSKLAAIGGQPARAGEAQIWDVATQKLLLSVSVTFDTLYGGSWSPDGKKLAFGCADNSVRAINAETGEQVLFQGAHEDWVHDTVFSPDGSHLVSVGRDMSVKLTEVATQRFIDNVTSITPGGLKGGLSALDRHPKFDHVVVGGSDGTPRMFRMHRHSARVIGDDANHIFDLFPMTGRIWNVRMNPVGDRIAAVSSLNGKGEVLVCTYEYSEDVPGDIKAIMAKVPGNRSPEERKKQQDYKEKGTRLLAKIPVADTALYAVAFHPSNGQIAVAGADGKIRVMDAANGNLVTTFDAVTVQPTASKMATFAGAASTAGTADAEKLPSGTTLTELQIDPATPITLAGPFAYAQIRITGKTNAGEWLDVTRMATAKLSSPVASITRSGVIRPIADGSASLEVQLGNQSAKLPIEVRDCTGEVAVDFIRDVNPVLSKLGCNQGTCHGAAKGKNGFKLSLRGYDPLFDIRAFTDDLASRRVNVASPDDSLMLLKASGTVPHVGGQLTTPNEPYYQIIRKWIADGAKLELTTPRVTKIELSPQNPMIQREGQKQQFRVLAHYADGRIRDVSQEAFVETGNMEVASADRSGLLTALRRGEAPVLARYEGAYAATTLTVMGDRSGFVWQAPESWGRIDELVAAKWQAMKIAPSGLCSDADFIRRASLDLTGLPPTAQAVSDFLADSRETRVKRNELVEKLIASDDAVDYWTNKWADLLQVNRKFLGAEGATAFRGWIRAEIAQNTPYDQFCRKILTATGSNKANPAASYFKVLRSPAETMENTTHLFLGVRFNCNKCHDHPFERWTQDQYYETAAYLAQYELKRDPESGDRNIGGTAVEGAKPLYEIVSDRGSGDVKHERTGEVTAPKFPFAAKFESAEKSSRREQLAAWITSPDNIYFAKSYVNRMWGYMMGVGLMEPLDDLRAGNPPTNPELLEYLTHEFVQNGFNVRHIQRLICQSRTYQLSVESNRWNKDDRQNYSHALPKRLPAEVLFDSIHAVTGHKSAIPGLPAGTRAAAIPDSGIDVPSGFLATTGRPVRESACECERVTGLQLGPIMTLISGPVVNEAISHPANELAKLTASTPDDVKLIQQLYLRVLNRPATESEIQTALSILPKIDADHKQLLAALYEREAIVKPIREQQESARLAAIEKAKSTLEAYEVELAPRLAEMEKQKAEKTAKLEAELKEYEAKLPELAVKWEAKIQNEPLWTPLKVTALSANNKAKLEQLDDLSIVAEAKDGPVTYTVEAETPLSEITGIRLEALADEKLPANGPGLAQNGNFVLTEFDVDAAPLSNKGTQNRVNLEKPLADFSQENFSIAAANDNNRAANNGWAISGGIGKTHWATFEIKAPIKDQQGTKFVFKLLQNYTDKKHNLGKFRLSVTTAKKPIGLSFPHEVTALVSIPADQRTDEQMQALFETFKKQDAEFDKKSKALAESKKPLPIDPKLKELRDTLTEVSLPVPPDAKLTRLQADVATSTKQLESKRLTVAQDVVWALINSPAFLFNH